MLQRASQQAAASDSWGDDFDAVPSAPDAPRTTVQRAPAPTAPVISPGRSESGPKGDASGRSDAAAATLASAAAGQEGGSPAAPMRASSATAHGSPSTSPGSRADTRALKTTTAGFWDAAAAPARGDHGVAQPEPRTGDGDGSSPAAADSAVVTAASSSIDDSPAAAVKPATEADGVPDASTGSAEGADAVEGAAAAQHDAAPASDVSGERCQASGPIGSSDNSGGVPAARAPSGMHSAVAAASGTPENATSEWSLVSEPDPACAVAARAPGAAHSARFPALTAGACSPSHECRLGIQPARPRFSQRNAEHTRIFLSRARTSARRAVNGTAAKLLLFQAGLS